MTLGLLFIQHQHVSFYYCFIITYYVAFYRFLAISTGIIYWYYAYVLKIDEEEYGGHGALLQEGLFASFTLFLVNIILLQKRTNVVLVIGTSFSFFVICSFRGLLYTVWLTFEKLLGCTYHATFAHHVSQKRLTRTV